jgi:hypothetical protein
MSFVSNVSVRPVAEAAPEALIGTPPAPAASNKLNILSAREATIVDSRGRLLKIKRLSAIDKVRLFKAAGAVLSENRVLGGYYSTACSVTEIDGMPVPFPSTELQLDALVQRLDEDGLEAAVRALVGLTIDADVSADAKN